MTVEEKWAQLPPHWRCKVTRDPALAAFDDAMEQTYPEELPDKFRKRQEATLAYRRAQIEALGCDAL